ncbi:chondroitin AC/alginate lyase [Aspergillus uvarum CBS 121591]|uniref:Chondroitin AC/alginate lyase n=1 Tax=Aspergillus uvarum CBS 121591 TaxID=1448315 RepID=A0A319CP11_9EURO|nr:chondroitin AC/alginate lyase [Aspergillus uvarum CBS 121591]PYH86189.1 chondroitin AC/alginate lyase [Aspergillus uvarum CBS 121591]
MKKLLVSISAVVALSIRAVQCTVQDVPAIFGPVPIVATFSGVDSTSYLKRRPSDFVHPGIWHTHDDLELIRNKVLSGQDPWASAYQQFSADSYSQASYEMQGPKEVIARGQTSNYTSFAHDARAAWQNALMWYITKNESHWTRSTTILDAWGTNLTNIIGIDRSLMIGLDGDLFVNAAELMRWEGNWTEVGARWQGGSGFSTQLYWLFARQSAAVGQANYGMVSIKAMLSFAVYLDDVQLYNYAMNAFIQDNCAGIFAQYNSETGQSVEAGRDQGHTMSGIGWSAYGARVGLSQGVNLFEVGDNLLLKAAEYAAKYNLNSTVIYDPKWSRCEAVLVNGPWEVISAENRGVSNKIPIWDLLYYQYVVKQKATAPWTTKAQDYEGFEGAVSSNDHPSWGGLIWAAEA